MRNDRRLLQRFDTAWTSSLVETWGAHIVDRTLQHEIGLAKTVRDIEKIARLRYELYIERDRKSYAAAHHDSRLFCDDMDSSSLIFFASCENEIGASVRLTRAADAVCDSQLAPLIETANLSDAEIDTAVINSRFVMKPNWRMRNLTYSLFQEVYVTGLLAGAERALLTTRPSLARTFERFGFRTSGLEVEDNVAGRLLLMELRLRDLSHLKATKSVLLDAPGFQAAFDLSYGVLL